MDKKKEKVKSNQKHFRKKPVVNERGQECISPINAGCQVSEGTSLQCALQTKKKISCSSNQPKKNTEKKKQSIAYKNERKKANARNQKYVASMSESQREERKRRKREAYQKKKEMNLITRIKDLTPREQKNKRRYWREATAKSRNKNNQCAADLITECVSPEVNISSSNSSPMPVFAQRLSGQKIRAKKHASVLKEVQSQNQIIAELQRKVIRLQKSLEQKKPSSNVDTSSPKRKVKSITQGYVAPTKMADVQFLEDQNPQPLDKKSVFLSEQQMQKGKVKKNDEQQPELENLSKQTEKPIEDEISQLSNNAVLIQAGDVETILTEDAIFMDEVLTEKSKNEKFHLPKQFIIYSPSQRLKEKEARITTLKTRLTSTVLKRSLKRALLESEIKTANARRDFYESKKSLLSLKRFASNSETLPLSLTEQKMLDDLKEEKSAFNIEKNILQKQLVVAEKKAAKSIKTYYEMKKTSNPCS